MWGGKKLKEFIDKTETVDGTDINRANLMAIQGFQDNNTEIAENSDGTVTTIDETNGDNEVMRTVITVNNDGTTIITEKFPYNTAREITKTITINALGNIISEVLS